MTVQIDQQALIEQATAFDPTNENVFLGDMFDIYLKNVDIVPPYWSRQRDVALRAAWKDGNYGSAMMYLSQTKLSTIPMVVVARDKSITAHVQQAAKLTQEFHNNSGFGLGWYQTMMPFAEDYLGQDNGGFMEILGDGPSDGPITGIPSGVWHLDAARCTRTGNPEFPVVYLGDDGQKYKLHFTRVFFMSQMPSASAKMNGVGFSSVSRSLRILQNLLNIIDYKDEKMGARAASQILVGSGITGKEIIKAIAAAETMMTSLGLEHYARTIAMGSTDGSVGLERVDLNTLDPFDESASYTFSAYAIALAWGLEFQEVMPVSGTRQTEIVSLQRSRTKLPYLYTSAFMEQANMKLVPPYLELRLDYQDDQADQQKAVIEDITSRSLERQMNSGVTTPEIAQQTLFERGYLSEEQFRQMQLSRGVLSDGSPVQSLFFDPRYQELLLIPDEMLVTRIGDPEMALTAIEANEVYIYSIMGNTRSSTSLMMANEALAALAELKKPYQAAMFEPDETIEVVEDGEEEESETDQEEQNGSTTVERRGVGEGSDGEPGKSFSDVRKWFVENNKIRWTE